MHGHHASIADRVNRWTTLEDEWRNELIFRTVGYGPWTDMEREMHGSIYRILLAWAMCRRLKRVRLVNSVCCKSGSCVVMLWISTCRWMTYYEPY